MYVVCRREESSFVAVCGCSFVLIVDALASATEDYSRHKADRRSNNRKTLCLRDNSFLTVAWKDIKVRCRIVGHILAAAVTRVYDMRHARRPV